MFSIRVSSVYEVSTKTLAFDPSPGLLSISYSPGNITIVKNSNKSAPYSPASSPGPFTQDCFAASSNALCIVLKGLFKFLPLFDKESVDKVSFALT